eukprot:TRINITY_DN2467_c0_g1_i1.p2 TRINITY_DN2467_c0_g1~~TRINITY_DN2467_c0_g1_i1.p2  ORF type:complete len:138 (-),score=21.59 TRINITY_DN2467_c0_g1_i1:1035-1448(-)
MVPLSTAAQRSLDKHGENVPRAQAPILNARASVEVTACLDIHKPLTQLCQRVDCPWQLERETRAREAAEAALNDMKTRVTDMGRDLQVCVRRIQQGVGMASTSTCHASTPQLTEQLWYHHVSEAGRGVDRNVALGDQ